MTDDLRLAPDIDPEEAARERARKARTYTRRARGTGLLPDEEIHAILTARKLALERRRQRR